MHADFTRCAKFSDVYAKFAHAICIRFHTDAHAGCMQISCAVRKSEAVTGDVRTQFACRFHADAHANPMPAPGARSMKTKPEACS